ncbi:hypothetical protein PINS_up000122 [Pythium insidiosum]|nr:hypothetical protein PINS_up000122 [Pythium insidiosum]
MRTSNLATCVALKTSQLNDDTDALASSLLAFGGVGTTFLRVLKDRFASLEGRVTIDVVAIGDSSGFVWIPTPSGSFQGIEWGVLDRVLTAKHSQPVCRLASFDGIDKLAVTSLDRLLDAVVPNGAFDLALVDCTSSPLMAAQLIKAKRLGIAVVLANKLPISLRSNDYLQLVADDALVRSQRVRYEATVGAGIPVLAVLQRLVASRDSIHSVQGSLSGTMNYMLTAMLGGATFSEALHAARSRGITEADPREDLSGADVARKMIILARELRPLEPTLPEIADVEIVPMLPPEMLVLSCDEFLVRASECDDGQCAMADSLGHSPVQSPPPLPDHSVVSTHEDRA